MFILIPFAILVGRRNKNRASQPHANLWSISFTAVVALYSEATWVICDHG
jgi:hypothetical protein